MGVRTPRATWARARLRRPLLPGEPLDDIFHLQVGRKLSCNLTLHYQRVLYVLEPTAEAHVMKGKRVRLYEDDGGNVSIRAGEIELSARAFPKESQARVSPGDIVANKHLGAVLSMIRARQLERDEERAAKARMVRERQLLQQRMKKARGT